MPAQVEGLRQSVKALENLGVDVDDLKDAFAEVSDMAASSAARHAPSRSGKLRASVRGNRAKNKAVVTAGRASVKYAGPINYGWKSRNIRASGFMQKADAETAPQALAVIEAGITAAINKNGLT